MDQRRERGFGSERNRAATRTATNAWENRARGFTSRSNDGAFANDEREGASGDEGRRGGAWEDDELERVSKILARRGTCSRREAERLIEDGRVLVDGETIELGFKARANARIEITGEGTRWLREKLTVIVNKPPGYVSNLPAEGEIAAAACVEPRNAWMRAMEGTPMDDLKRVTRDVSSFNVCGRLDKDSRGLLILTEDGALARSVIGGNGVLKKYVVTTDADVRESHMRSLNGRVQLDGVELLPMNVQRLGHGSRTLEFNLREGKNRQIRRVCEKFGLRVVDLHRVQIGDVQIGDLPEGAWRLMSEREVRELRELEFE
jgi:23S rRNA pseudouridine2604 synthase